MDDDAWTSYTDTAADMYSTYPPNQYLLNAGDFMEWAVEGLQFAETYVYPGK